MRIFKKDSTKEDLKLLLRERINRYYPELNSYRVTIKGHFLKKQHTSYIYQFDIYNSKGIFKSVVVKKRIFNNVYNNNIVEDTKREYSALQHLKTIPNLNISFPKILDAIPEQGLLITEKFRGKTLFSYLNKASYFLTSNTNKIFLKKLCFNTGEWLREFHRATSIGEMRKINVHGYINKAEVLVHKLSPLGLKVSLGEGLIDKMRSLGREIIGQEFPLALKHSDMQPMNVICSNGRIVVLDIGATKVDIIIKDVCNFVVGMNTVFIKSICSFWNKVLLDQLINEFLCGYFNDGDIPSGAVEFVKSLGMLEQLDLSLIHI
mgnify:CR=1 FL=1